MTRRDRKPKHRHPCAPTGYPTPADAEHAARVDAARVRREAERQERRSVEWKRRAALTPEARGAEDDGQRRAASIFALAAALGPSVGLR